MQSSKYSRHLLPFLLAFFIVGSMGTYTAAAMPEIMSGFQISATQASLVFIFWGTGMVIGSLIVTFSLQNQSLERRLLLASLLALVMTYTARSTSDYLFFAISFIGLGIASGIILTSGHAYVGRKSNLYSASQISALDLALSVGAVSAPLFVSYFHQGQANNPNWREVLSLYQALLLLFTGIILFSEFEPVTEAKVLTLLSKDTAKLFIKHPILIWFSLISIAYHAFEYGHTYWFVTYAAALADIDSDAARGIFASFLMGSIVSRSLLACFATDKTMPFILAIAITMSLALIIYLPSYEDSYSLYLVNSLLGMAFGAIFPCLLSIAVTTSDDLGSLFSSCALIFGAVGTQISAILLGSLIDIGGIGWVYPVLAIIGLTLLIFAHIFIRNSLNLIKEDQLNEAQPRDFNQAS